MESKEKISGWQSVIIEQISLKQTFVIAVLVGSFFTLVGAHINSSFLGFWLPVIVIGCYCSLVALGAIDVPRVVAGDSCYYLGFIFTLVSLIASLSLISMAPESGQINFSQIVSSFGVALVTTVIGLVARLLITSFDIETKQRQEQIERDIEQSLEVFKGQIDVLVSTVQSGVIKVSSQTEQVILDTLEQYERVNSTVLRNFESSFNDCQTKFSQAVNGLTNKLNKIEVSSDVVTKPVLASIKELTDNLSGFSMSFNKVAEELQMNNSQLAYHIAGSTDTVNGHINAFETKLNAVVIEQASQYQQSLSDIGDAVLSSIGDIKDIKLEAQDDLAAKAKKLTEQFSELSLAIDKSVPTLTASLNTLVEETSMIHSQLADSPKVLQTYISSLNELAEKHKTVIADLPKMDNINEKLLKFEQLLEVSGKRTLETYKRFDESAAVTEGYTSQVAKDIATVYSNLAQEIQKLRGSSV